MLYVGFLRLEAILEVFLIVFSEKKTVFLFPEIAGDKKKFFLINLIF